MGRRLIDKVAVVTGAARGIGRSAAELFAREGARVVLADVNEALGAAATQTIREEGGDALFVKADISACADVAALFDAVEREYGALHVLYNNASIFLGSDDGPVADLAEETWERVLAVNLRGLYLCCKYGIPLIIETGGGSVITTSSSAGVMGIPGCDAYTATKGATIALTRSMAVEYGGSGIRVNCIAPAGVDTEMLRESSLDNPGFDEEAFLDRAPMARYGTPNEIARLALFLASDESSYLNGAIIRADGGITVTPIS
jgi:NAD(P)-dependent dehydrogenase (short-subunit alcohol dehydrogenase family)